MSESGLAPVRVGDLLAGKYRVERILGAGGMGIVVAALHEQLEQRVAIKFVREEALGNEDAVQRFLREARASVKLKSEHAARVLDVGTLDSGAPYMVMEYLEGNDLSAQLDIQPVVPVEVAAEWIVQACEAVAEAHSLGIVHRDLKPQNLFLARTVGGSSKVKVLDFGVSKSIVAGAAGGLTQTRAMLGSPLYMSPEQMRSARDVDARADVWALGVVLYELLTKHWPFEAESMPELCLKVVSEPPTPLDRYRSDVPKEMTAIIDRCLSKNPADRYANAAELASALEPLGPAASRFVAERARLAIGSSTGANAAAPVSRAGSPPVVFARTEATPAAWGSGQSHAQGPKRSSKLWLAAGVGALAIAAAGLLFVHGRDSVPAPVPSPGIAATRGPDVLPPQPPATLEAPPTPAASTGAIASAPSASAPVPAAASASAQPAKPTSTPRVVPAAKPKPHDDDIPSLR